MNYKKFLFLGSIFPIIFGLFGQFLLKGQILFPGNYMLAWYEPWKTDHVINGIIQIVHKPIASDIFRQIYPFKILSVEMLKNFQWPLWNPYNGSGTPLLATSNMGLLDPFNSLFAMLPYPYAWTTYALLQIVGIFVFTFLFCRTLRLSSIASLFASLVFVLAGPVIVRIPYTIFGTAIAMLPFSLFIIESYLQNTKTKKIFFLPFTIFLIIISTSPQISLFIFLFLVFYLFYRSRQDNSSIVVPFIFIGIGIFLSALQILPTIELFLHANVNSQTSSFIFQRFLLPPQHIISLFVPNFFGSDATYNYWGSGDYIESTMYIGLLPCLFASIGLWIKSEKNIDIRKFLLGVLTISFLLSFKWLGSEMIASLHIPILSTDIPSRIFILSSFAIALLGGYGVETCKNFALFKQIKKISFYYICFFLVLFLGVILLYKFHFPCLNPVIKNCGAIAFRNSLLEYCGFFIFVISFIVLLKIKKPLIILPYITVVIVGVTGLYNAYKYLPFSPKDNVMPNNELVSYLQQHNNEGRIFGFGEANIATDFATYYHWYDPNYYHPLFIQQYGQLVQFGNTNSFKTALPRSDIEIVKDIQLNSSKSQQRQRLLDLLGVTSLVYKKTERPLLSTDTILWQNKDWYIIKNYSAMPRVRFASSFEVISNQNTILQRLFSSEFNPAHTIILDKQPRLKLDPKPGFAFFATYAENTVDLFAYTTGNTLLVLNDTYFPGWKAYIDKKEVPIFKANYTFRAIELPKGKHTIQFVYKPLSFKIGLLITHAALVAFLICVYIRYKNKFFK